MIIDSKFSVATLNAGANTNRKSLLCRVFAVVYLFALLGGLSGLKSVFGFSFDASSFVYPLLYLVTLVLIYANKEIVKVFDLIRLSYFVFLGGVVSSVLSHSPVISLISLISLYFNFIFAAWFVYYYDAREISKILFSGFCLIAVLSLCAGVVDYSSVVYHDPLSRSNVLGFENIKGLFSHKIHAGLYAASAGVFAWHLFHLERRAFYLFWIALFAIWVLASGSSLALVVSLFTVFGAYQFHRIVKRIGVSVFLVLFAYVSTGGVLIAIFGGYEYFLASIGREATLTGRTTIWGYGLDYIISNPIIGSGIGVFFDGSLRSPGYALWEQMRWFSTPSFHSGYIQLFAEFGLVGAIGFLYIIYTSLDIRKSDEDVGLFVVVLIYVIAGLGASLLITPSSFAFVAICIAFFRSRRLHIKF